LADELGVEVVYFKQHNDGFESGEDWAYDGQWNSKEGRDVVLQLWFPCSDFFQVRLSLLH
jgi:hypothetical protein